MSDSTKILSGALREELKELMREVLREEFGANSSVTGNDKDTLLTVEEAGKLMCVSRRWLYRHADKLPFARRISRKNLRFSEAGLRRWIVTRKPDSRR